MQCDCSEEFLQQLLAVVIGVGIPIDLTRGHVLLLPVDADLPQEVFQLLYVGCPFASALELQDLCLGQRSTRRLEDTCL